MSTYVLRDTPARTNRFRIDYAAALNSAQLEAATTLEGPVLVVAGAGTGKTRTLTFRVARLVESGIAAPAILLLTFTRRAADEMVRRAGELLGGLGLEQVTGGTFHSFANLVLRRYAPLFGWPERFTILDRGDSEEVIALVRAQRGLDGRERRFPRKKTLATLFSTATNRNLSLGELLEGSSPHLLDELTEIEACRDAYADWKRDQNLLDYDDLLVRLRDRLADTPELVERLRRVHRYIMVDEYQDTNHLQAEIVQRIAGPAGNVMAVGDDAQSIYAFRGADVRNILRFADDYPGCRIVTLAENYRSTQPVLDVCNSVIAGAKEGYEKTLLAHRKGGVRPCLVPAPDEHIQSLFVRQRICELVEDGVPLRQIAVLFRASFHSFDLEIELARAGIPFLKRGGIRLMETAHIKDVISHLRVLENPRDVVSWNRLLQLQEEVGPRAAQAAVRWLFERGGAAGALAGIEVGPGLRARAVERLVGLGNFLEGLATPTRSPAEMIERVIEAYQPRLEALHRDDAPRRLRDLEQFAALAERYEGLAELLTDLVLDPPAELARADPSTLPGGATDDGPLVLSTIHSAKGLEWRAVFVLSAMEGRLPSVRAEEPDEIDEERRLLYVACTRAADELYLCYPLEVLDRSLGGWVSGRPSSFVASTPADILERLTLVDENA